MPKICKLCVCVLINKLSIELFMCLDLTVQLFHYPIGNRTSSTTATAKHLQPGRRRQRRVTVVVDCCGVRQQRHYRQGLRHSWNITVSISDWTGLFYSVVICQQICLLRMYLWWSLCTLHLHACQVRVTVSDSGLCCCVRLTSFER